MKNKFTYRTNGKVRRLFVYDDVDGIRINIDYFDSIETYEAAPRHEGPSSMAFTLDKDEKWIVNFMYWDVGITTQIAPYNTYREGIFGCWTGNGFSSLEAPAVLGCDGRIKFWLDEKPVKRSVFENLYLMTHLKPFKKQHITHWISKYNVLDEIVSKFMAEELDNIPEEVAACFNSLATLKFKKPYQFT